MMSKGYTKPGDVEFLRSYDHNDAEVYPHHSVRVVRPGQHSWKYALTRYVLTKRALYIGIALCVITVLLIVIVAVSVGSRSRHTPVKKFGLEHYPLPADGSNTIQYRAGDKNNYKHLLENVTNFLKPYMPESQTGPNYMDCSEQTAVEKNKSCRFDVTKSVDQFKRLVSLDYGFKESYPCIWLQLRLPVGMKPKAVNVKSKYYTEVKSVLGGRYNSDFIGVSCKGKTPADDEKLSRGKEEKILYFPDYGFPLYYFPATSQQTYLSPLVMVSFRELHSDELVHIECTAWALTPSNELSSKSELFTTEFKVKVY